jgi:predicted phosphodiesterase
MRIALLSDIHGNSIALHAVLDDIRAQGGVDAYWVLGDLAAIGYDPTGVLERVAHLERVKIVRGNTDRYLVSGIYPPPGIESVKADSSLLPKYTEVVASFSWTLGALAAAGWLDWVAALPLEQRAVLPDGTRLLGVHAAPGTDDGHGIRPGMQESELESLLAGCGADLVCVGHTHRGMDATVNGVRVVNLGSVSNPQEADLRASYVLLNANTSGYQLEHRRVDYDRQAVIAEILRIRHPASEFIIRLMRGQNRPA